MTTVAPALRQPTRPRSKSETGALVGLLLAMIVLGILGYQVSVFVAGMLYVPLFIYLAIAKPRFALFLIFAEAPFSWDVGGGPMKMAVAELSLMLAIPFLVIRGWRLRPRAFSNPLWIPVGAYFAVCILATLLSNSWEGTVNSLLQMAVYLLACVYVFASCIKDTPEMESVFYGLLLSCAVLALVEMATGSPYVLGLHKNLVGTELMYATVIGFELWMAKTTQRQKRRWLSCLLAVLVCGLVFSVSRGAWIGTAGGLLVILLSRRQFALAGRSALIVAPLIVLAWFMLPDETRRVASNFSADSKTSSAGARIVSLEYAYGVFQSSPIVGVGVGLRKQYDATNVVMSTLAETGILGLVTFAAIFGTLFWMAWHAQRRIELHDPTFSLLTVGVALAVGKLLHGSVDHYWSRGIIPVWAGAGLVVYAYNYARRLPVGRHSARSPA